jgi:integrase/recombinase XerD
VAATVKRRPVAATTPVLLLLARLGLRTGEIVALQLDDIEWRAGEILLGGKGLLHDRFAGASTVTTIVWRAIESSRLASCF